VGTPGYLHQRGRLYSLFGERWSLLQGIGVALVLGGVFFLSYYHQHVSITYTLFLFSILALLYAPFFVVQKAALHAGESIAATFFWLYFAAKLSGFLYPLLRGNWRTSILGCSIDGRITSLGALAIVCSLTGFYAITRAYAAGFASLVSVAANVQPFFTILFASFLFCLFPRYAPRELLTAQSVQVKLCSFAIVFIGLGMLAVG
jgi:drug/metabolite transporter (DMT)-like permease